LKERFNKEEENKIKEKQFYAFIKEKVFPLNSPRIVEN